MIGLCYLASLLCGLTFADAPNFEPLFSSAGARTVVPERAPEGKLNFVCGTSIESICSKVYKICYHNAIVELH